MTTIKQRWRWSLQWRTRKAFLAPGSKTKEQIKRTDNSILWKLLKMFKTKSANSMSALAEPNVTLSIDSHLQTCPYECLSVSACYTDILLLSCCSCRAQQLLQTQQQSILRKCCSIPRWNCKNRNKCEAKSKQVQSKLSTFFVLVIISNNVKMFLCSFINTQ